MGSINLDNTGSGSGITLSSDGTSLLLDGTAVGGGGADLYAANPSSATDPVASGTNAVAIGSVAVASGTTSTAVGFGSLASNTNAFAGPVSNSSGVGSVALGIGTNSTSYGATGNYALAIGYQSKATHANSVSIGVNVQSTATNQINLGGTADTVRISQTYTLPTSDGSANQVLTTNGSGVVSFADAGGGMPTTGGTFTGDVTFDGATAGRDVLFDRSENKLNFAHDTKLTIGNNNELEIQKHTGGGVSLSYTKNGGGNLSMTSDSDIDFKVSNQDRITLRTSSFGGQVELYNAGSKKFSTSSTGATVYGTLVATTFSGSGANLTNLPASDLVNDTSPQLGGNLDVQAREINTSTANGNIVFNPNGTGVVEVKGAGGNDGTLQLNCSANSHGVKIKSPPHSAGASYTLTLPNDDGNASEFLQTNGSGVLTWAAAGADLYAANNSSATDPTASGANSIAIGDSAVSSAVASIAIGGDTDATANYNIALGFGAQALTGTSAVAIGKSRASGTDSFAANITNSTSSYGAIGANSIAMGKNAKADYGVAIGIAGATGTGPYVSGPGGLAIGNDVAVSAHYGMGIGTELTVNKSDATAIGHNLKTAAKGQFVYGAGSFAADGDAQGSNYILRADTTDATATVLTTTNGSAASDNQIIAASDTCITFDGTITAMQNGAQAYTSFRIEGLLVNDGGTTTLANSAITVIQNSSNWGLALSADNTNNALAVTCTGEANHNIRWVANIRTSEVTYA